MIQGHCRRDLSAWTCEQMYDVAADMESYPAFIRWCKSTLVRRRDDKGWEVENHFGAGPFEWAFRSRAEGKPPHQLDVFSTDGPFRRFHLSWRFTPLPEGGCRMDIDYSMSLRSPLAQGFARLLTGEAEAKALDCFEERARGLFGDGKVR